MNIKAYAKYSLLILSVTAFLTFSLIAIGVYNNNLETTAPSKQELQHSLESAIEWLENNRKKIFNNHNSALWWMLKEASQASDNKQLKKIYMDYKHSFLDIRPRNVWSPYFYDDYTPIIDHITDLYPLHEYQLFFIYSLSCSPSMENEPVIKKQLRVDFCSNHFLHPRCITHQQMSVRYLNKKQCGDHSDLSKSLLDIIYQELTFDFRVTDSYVQRALMLSDGGISLKPIWITRILDNQQEDGGWPDFYPLLKLGETQFGTTSIRPAIGPKKSDFHATAQATWLLTLLIDQSTGNNNAIEK